MATPPVPGPGMPGAFTGPQGQAGREVNTASLCRIGQETVQDIVSRTMEIFQLLRNMQLPNGVSYHTATHQDRQGKLQEHLRQLSVLFRKLRLVYDKCNENCAGLDPIAMEQVANPLIHPGLLVGEHPQLIPYVEDEITKHEDHSLGNQLHLASEERREIVEEIPQNSRFLTGVTGIPSVSRKLQLVMYEGPLRSFSKTDSGKLKQKNQQLKQIMDQLRNLIWDINAMMAMRN
ncbi:mediator of RNA polymerase II transcription subunit 30-like isoform X3 [Narcine bancroftii]|uniref:mediator of RNA polymerase II transcription subunit 30-like isoform X3 n=1 Tax=Narcine bancroftii TaxID=1343680 RepID=UPI0038314F82